MKLFLFSLVFFSTFLFTQKAAGAVAFQNEQQNFSLNTIHGDSFFKKLQKKRPNLFLFRVKKRIQRSKRITAAVLAFPLPFGVLALHRIYLGTKPYVPVVYIATVGGVLGILPFIDFCVLLMDSNMDRYYNNSKVFMWVK